MAPPKVSFFTPGRRLPHDDSYIIVDQSYVHYTPPAVSHVENPSHLPILFIHGGGLTGAIWESTPDLRPGWAPLAASAGYMVYILDTVDSGRSARAPDSIRTGLVEHRTAKQVWTRFRLGSAEKFDERSLFEGSQFPIEAFDALLAGQATRRRTNDEVEMKGIIDVIKIIGPCQVIAHSHGCALLLDALASMPDYIQKMALIEPGGTSIASKIAPKIKTLVVWGDYVDVHDAWPAIAAPFDRISSAEVWRLPELGIKGNTHFPMADLNSGEIFEKVLGWLEERTG
jgi:pimeloyl-ACP methyl ester carboxylesterase